MDPTKSAFVGTKVELRCIFINSSPPVKISQVTWQKLLNGTKQNVAIANPVLGVSVLAPFKERVSFKQAAVRHRTPSLEDTTIVFSNLQLSDEAAYICEYTTFPAGNRENMVNLTVFGKNSLAVTELLPFWRFKNSVRIHIICEDKTKASYTDLILVLFVIILTFLSRSDLTPWKHTLRILHSF